MVEPSKARKKSVKKSGKKTKKPDKEEAQKKDKDLYEMDDYDDDKDDEELVRTPPSSHHPSEDEGADSDVSPVKTKPRNAKKAAAKKTTNGASKRQPATRKAKANGDGDINPADMMIKSRNKLVGDLQNHDLYDSNDDVVGQVN